MLKLSGWRHAAKLVSSDIAQHDHFGWSVAVSGPQAILGAWGDDDLGGAAGAAYVFDLRGCPPSWPELGR